MVSFRLPDALPLLRGWTATLYATIWCALLAAAIAGPVGTAAILSGPRSDPLLALGIDWQGIDPVRAGIITGAEARLQGVRPGDLLLVLDGVPLNRGAGPAGLHAGIDGSTSILVLQSPGAAQRQVRLTNQSANVAAYYAGTGLTPTSSRWVASLPFLLIAAFQIFVAVLLFQRRRDTVAALLSAGILGLTATDGTAHIFWDSLGWGKVISVALAPAQIALITGLLTFPSGRFEPRWIWAALLVMAAAMALPSGALPGIVATVLSVFIIGAVVAALVWRFLRDRKADGARQWRWAILGFVSGIFLIVIFLTELQPLVDELCMRNRTLAPWQPVFLGFLYSAGFVCMFGGLALSVLRYRLYDTQAAVSRSILFGALTLALLAIFAGSEKIIEVLGEEYFGESMGALASGLGAAFAAVAVGPLHHRIAHWAEHRFRTNLIHLRRDLPPLLLELSETADPETVARAALDHLAHGLHAVRGAVVTGGRVLATHRIAVEAIAGAVGETAAGPIGELKLNRRDPLFPVRLRLAADGRSVLLVGARPDDSLYDRQERDLIADLAGPLAQALRISADRTARTAGATARFEALERGLALLRDELRHGITTR